MELLAPAPVLSPRPRLVARPAGAGVGRAAPGVYRRRRMAALVVTGLVLVGSWTLVTGVIGVLGTQPDRAGASGPAVTHVVQPGESLWSIAATLTDGDVRPVVDELVRRNGGPVIEAGQVIELPPSR